jgi:hypothetical protein
VTARRVLREAKQIYFLGFGYHKATVDRLGKFVKDSSRVTAARVAGTSKGIPLRDWKAICDTVFPGSMTDATRYPFSVARFMREVARL